MASHTQLQSMVGPRKYDMVLRIDRFLDVFDEAKGWKLAVGEGSDERLETSPAVLIATIGKFNVGKTWLISKLCEESLGVAACLGLELGRGDHTEGLSVKLCRINMQTLAFLDTPGFDPPVTSISPHMLNAGHDGQKAIEQMMQELKRQEDLVKRVAFDFAQVYLVVLGYMKFDDQLQVLELIDQARRSWGSRKDVVFVHNLKDMTYEELTEEKNELTGLTYLESIQRLFMLQRNDVWVPDNESIVVLYGAFGDNLHGEDSVVMRHVFLTYDGPTAAGTGTQRPADPGCRNKYVFEYLRRMIHGASPKVSHIPAELTACVSRVAMSMVRRPPRTDVEVRYDKANRRMIARVVSAETRKQEREAMQVTATTDELDVALTEADTLLAEVMKNGSTPELLAALEEADHKVAEERAKAAARRVCSVPQLTGTSALPQDHGVTARSVIVAATSWRSTGGVIRHNESRVRAYYDDQAMWLCKVTIVAPALKKGEVQRLRETIQWTNGNVVGAEGVWMEEPAPFQEPTMKLCFTVTMRNTPEKQMAQLDAAGRPTVDAAGRVSGTFITFPAPTAEAPMVVYDKGTRPFSNDGESIEQVVVPVVIHTQFRRCVEDLAPVIHYGRGLLTVAVLCELSEEDHFQAANGKWINDADPTAMVVHHWEPGANGSDDDVDE